MSPDQQFSPLFFYSNKCRDALKLKAELEIKGHQVVSLFTATEPIAMRGEGIWSGYEEIKSGLLGIPPFLR